MTTSLTLRVGTAAAILLIAMSGAAAPADFVFGRGSEQFEFNSNGAAVAWPREFETVTNSNHRSAGEIRFKNKIFSLENPQVARAGGKLNFIYRWPSQPELAVVVANSLERLGGATVWQRDVEIRGPATLDSSLTVSLQSGTLPANTWLPLFNGIGGPLDTNDAAVFHFAGALPGGGAQLALPMVSVPGNNQSRILIAADPYFSTRFTSGRMEWTYPAKGGLENGCERRMLFVAAHHGSVEDSLDDFFRIALPDVAPGPCWLHDIALVDFDYLSDGGRGWFRDIDGLSTNLSRSDHRQAMVVLHGWYDFLGRYCFDPDTGQFDRQWTCFSSWPEARGKHPFGVIGGTRVPMSFEECKPVAMSLAKVHRRLQFARARGFRVGMYFADGVNAGDGLPGFETNRVLRWGGWQGPDSKGKSYFQNPLDPKVHDFYIAYAKAMLNEFGPDVDALIWDETFHVQSGDLGTDAFPGYADRAFMRLVREVTLLVDDYNRRHHRQIALMSSDDLGMFGDQAPYALVAHGTYQDSWCNPKAWSYGIFPNYRNVCWSCCWWDLSKWSWVDFAARNYQSPVSLTDGWGDDRGFAELTPAQQARAIALFNWRKQFQTRLKWFKRLPQMPAASGN